LNSRLLHATFQVSGLSPSSWQLISQGQQTGNPQGPPSQSIDTGRRFGAYKLVQKLRRRVRFNTCLGEDVEITCGHNEDQSPRVIWDGECSKTEAVMLADPNLDNTNCPKQEEWVVVQCRPTEVEVLRANFSLLYTVICLTENATTDATDIILTYKRGCLVCLGVTSVLKDKKIRQQISQTPLVVHSFLGDSDSRVKLFDSVVTKNPDSGFVPDSMPRRRPAHEMR
jgi:hypothetical protein